MKNRQITPSRSKIFGFPKYPFCSLCGRKAQGDIYARRLRICADCLSRNTWTEEKRIFADFILTTEDHGLNK